MSALSWAFNDNGLLYEAGAADTPIEGYAVDVDFGGNEVPESPEEETADTTDLN
jgi:hypothetical protein